MKLSILIPTLAERWHYLKRLRSVLDPQIAKFNGQIELLLDDSGRHVTTGEKRNRLINNCSGEYFVFIDDDDMVSKDYVDLVMNSLDGSPDVITYNGWMTTNGGSRVDFIIRLHERYEEREGKYYRFPNHICVMKKILVQHIKFKPVTQGEDYPWALEINNRKLLKREIHIPQQIYHYDYRTNK